MTVCLDTSSCVCYVCVFKAEDGIRDYKVTGVQTCTLPISSACGVPENAGAYSLNLTVVPATSLGYIIVWPTGAPMPTVFALKAPTGAVTENAAIVPAGTGGAINTYTTNTT